MAIRLVFAALTVLVLTTGVVQAKEWETSLQKHVAFFDRNGDGTIFPPETIEGVLSIGASADLAKAGALLSHLGFSNKSRPGKPPSPELPIEIENIKFGKHTSDSGVFDTEGRFVESKFEEIFVNHAHTKPDALTSAELDEMLKAWMLPGDRAGGFADYISWKLLFYVGKDQDGFLQKETVRKVFDGSLFYELASKKKNP